MASPAIGEVAVTFIVIGPVTSGVIRNDSCVPSFGGMLIFLVRDS